MYKSVEHRTKPLRYVFMLGHSTQEGKFLLIHNVCIWRSFCSSIVQYGGLLRSFNLCLLYFPGFPISDCFFVFFSIPVTVYFVKLLPQMFSLNIFNLSTIFHLDGRFLLQKKVILSPEFWKIRRHIPQSSSIECCFLNSYLRSCCHDEDDGLSEQSKMGNGKWERFSVHLLDPHQVHTLRLSFWALSFSHQIVGSPAGPIELRTRKPFGACRTWMPQCTCMENAPVYVHGECPSLRAWRMPQSTCMDRPFSLHFAGTRAQRKRSSQNRPAASGVFDNWSSRTMW